MASRPRRTGSPHRVGFNRARKLAEALPGVEESTAWGSPSLKVRGNWFAVVPTNRSAEPNSLAVRVDFPTRDELIAAAPDIYYIKEHYVNYPTVLVRLARIGDDALEDLLRMAWELAGRAQKRGRGGPRPAKNV
jgi:hypothetical protein